MPIPSPLPRVHRKGLVSRPALRLAWGEYLASYRPLVAEYCPGPVFSLLRLLQHQLIQIRLLLLHPTMLSLLQENWLALFMRALSMELPHQPLWLRRVLVLALALKLVLL